MAVRAPSAANLVERLAAVFAAAVPQRPADDGWFGPDSATWRLAQDRTAPVAGLRALMLQALHPLAMAGVEQHSDWRRDPVGRLVATSSYLVTTTYGERAEAEKTAARVRRIHERVRGVDRFTNRPYSASDPELLLWVHAALVDSSVAVARCFGRRLSDEDADRYVREMVVAAELIGIPRAMVPASTAALGNYLEAMRPELVCTPAAREAVGYVLNPTGLAPDIEEIWRDIHDAAIATLPSWAQAMYGFEQIPLTPSRAAEVRQALGVLDATFIAEPGALEARQRITLRMRTRPPMKRPLLGIVPGIA
jgi:uncharacterized protein (DUF2236 family)